MGANTAITLPLVSNGSYDFTVDWGDGNTNTITAWDATEKTHTYTTADDYTVRITDTFTGWSFSNGGDKDKLIEIRQWGDMGF